MELSRLRALRELASRHTMAAVADVLCLTASAVSQQIAQLEEKVGMPLVERQGRGVRLTRAGEVLVEHVERLLSIMDEAKSDLAQIKSEIAGVLRVAVFPTVAAALLPHVINALNQTYPYLQIVLDELEPADGLAALGSWRCDVSFVDDLCLQLRGKQNQAEYVHVLDDYLYALLPRRHPLAKKQTLSLAELKDEQWALDSASSVYAEFIQNLCRRAGYEPQVNANCRGFEVVSAMVSAGCSVTVMPGLRLAYRLNKVAAVKLAPEVKRKISLAYRRGERNHPAVKVFVAQVIKSSIELGLHRDK